MDEAAIEFTESTTVTLEWTLRDLKGLFDCRYSSLPRPAARTTETTCPCVSRGEQKSSVTKSARFGPDGRWQVLFYANSGSVNGGENSGHISLYLSCEVRERPTQPRSYPLTQSSRPRMRRKLE
jgi:hypothetical protein